MSQGQRDAEPELRTWHIQVWCAVCLVVVFVAQLSQGILLTNVLTVLLGLFGIVSRLRWGNFYLLVGVGFAQSLHFFLTERRTMGVFAVNRPLDLQDFLLALGVLGFAAGYHRLQGIWHHLWPPDPRERRGQPRPTILWMRPRPPVVQHKRTQAQLRATEILAMVIMAPLVVLAGVLLFTVYRPDRRFELWLELPGGLGRLLPPGLGPFVLMFWTLLVVGWITSHVLSLWRLWTMPPTSARMFVNDQLWNQLRGEQRRIARWRAWRKLQ